MLKIKSKFRFSLTLLAASLALAGCVSVGPDYARPKLDAPATLGVLGTQEKASSSVDLLSWWESFNDPVLNSLLTEAAANNQDLALASARIAEARATAAGTRASRFPIIDASLSGSKNRTSENVGKLSAGAEPISKDTQLGLNASYEVDFWGKLARADEAAKARMLAQQANRGLVQNSLYSTLAQNYFNLRALDAQLTLAQSAAHTRQENLRLQGQRYSAGSIGQLDLHQAQSEAAAAEISLLQTGQALAHAESAMALLLGRSPSAISQPVIARGNNIETLYRQLQLPANLPSDLINRRPDIIAAEQALVAANADVGQAKALYFPSIKLTSGIGYESRVFQDLLAPASLMWNLGANLLQPVFRAGAIGAVVSGAEARKNQALAQYVQTVQGAFRDTHDAISNANANAQIYIASERRVAALKDSLRLAQLRYKNGYSAYLEVLSAQRDFLQAEANLIDTRRAHLAAVVSLYKAIGGGWEVPRAM
jgi:multidrug efflux system outer membrane protein